VEAEKGQKSSKKYLMGPQMDFWLIGGASIVCWLGMHLYQEVFTNFTHAKKHIGGAPYLFATLALFVNFPHFMASYQLAYNRGRSFIFRNWFQLIFVPIALTFFFVIGFLFYKQYSLLGVWLEPLDQFIYSTAGFRLGVGHHKLFGPEILNIMINLMFFTVGWHYTKQAFGCTLVYAKLDNYQLSNIQRTLLKWSLFGIWFYTLFLANAGLYNNQYHGAAYYTFQVPAAFITWTENLTILGFWACVIFIFGKNYIQNKALPSAHMLTPMACMFIWWMPQFRNHMFYSYAVPFFHSLQYLPFSYKVAKEKAKKTGQSQNIERTMARNFIVLIILGIASFELVPEFLDIQTNSKGLSGLPYWFIAFQLFINIHHYFIDNVIWRMKDPETRNYLFA
jgi:hypothetical protein